jgi:hypothetical protein
MTNILTEIGREAMLKAKKAPQDTQRNGENEQNIKREGEREEGKRGKNTTGNKRKETAEVG